MTWSGERGAGEFPQTEKDREDLNNPADARKY